MAEISAMCFCNQEYNCTAGRDVRGANVCFPDAVCTSFRTCDVRLSVCIICVLVTLGFFFLVHEIRRGYILSSQRQPGEKVRFVRLVVSLLFFLFVWLFVCLFVFRCGPADIYHHVSSNLFLQEAQTSVSSR